MLDILLTIIGTCLVTVVIVRISIACIGSIGTAVLLLTATLMVAWSGWQWLLHSDNLAFVLLGYAIPVVITGLLAAGVVAALRTAPASDETVTVPVDGVSTPMGEQ